jgi:vacuolar-type H+-ATPase subunit E/Vma4
LASQIAEPAYLEVIKKWIVEGVCGLDSDAVFVNASQIERKLITGRVLTAAAQRVKEITGRDVDMKLSPEPALRAQGITVTAADGRTAFNNQVEARLNRYNQRIQSMIYDTLFDVSD